MSQEDDQCPDQAIDEPAYLSAKYDEEIVQLYRDEATRLRRHLMRRMGVSFEFAADVVQDSFLATRMRWHVVRFYDQPVSYLYRVAENRTRRLLGAKSAGEKPCPNPHANAHCGNADPIPDLLLRLRIDEAITRLPPQVAQAARLYYLNDMSVAQVARIMRISENTVKGYLFEARKRLRDDLGEEFDHWTET